MPPMRPRILLIGTGGTLGMRPREPDRALAPDEFGSTVAEHVPELSQIAEVDTRVLFHRDSTDLGPAEWMEIARAVCWLASDAASMCTGSVLVANGGSYFF